MKRFTIMIMAVFISIGINGCGSAISEDTYVSDANDTNDYKKESNEEKDIKENDSETATKKWIGTYRNENEETIVITAQNDTTIEMEITQLDETGERYTLSKTLDRDPQNDNVATEMFNSDLDIYYTLDMNGLTVTYPEGWYPEAYFKRVDSSNASNQEMAQKDDNDNSAYPKLDSDILELCWVNIYGSDPTENRYVKDEKGNVVEVYSSGGIKMLTLSYDENGRVKTIQEGTTNIISEFERNEKGQKVKITNKNSIGDVTGFIEFEYNSAGQRVHNYIYDSDRNLQLKRTYSYDGNGNRTECYLEDGMGNMCGNPERYEYDSTGKLVRMYDSTGLCHEYIYDNGKFVRFEQYDTSGNLIATDYTLYYLSGNLYEILPY